RRRAGVPTSGAVLFGFRGSGKSLRLPPARRSDARSRRVGQFRPQRPARVAPACDIGAQYPAVRPRPLIPRRRLCKAEFVDSSAESPIVTAARLFHLFLVLRSATTPTARATKTST